MRSRPIPGLHSACDLYAVLSQKHRPANADAIAVEVRRLHQSGLTNIDIERALRLSPTVVADAIGAPPPRTFQS